MKIWLCYCWENRSTPALDGSQLNVTDVAHIASSKEKAIAWCKANSNFAGTKKTTERFVPWHWWIMPWIVDSDEGYCSEQAIHLNPSGKSKYRW